MINCLTGSLEYLIDVIQIYYREIDTLQDVSSLFYDLPGAYSKRNKKIFVDDSNPLDIIPVDGLIQVCKDRWTSESQ